MAWSQGVYIVKNKDKYLGTRSTPNPSDRSFTITKNNPYYRSSWEQRLMTMLDNNANVVKWAYEYVIIPYVNFDGKTHRYIMDFYVEMLDKDRSKPNIRMLIEVKPRKDGEPPKKPKINNKKAMMRYMYESKTYITNMNKWKSAELYCKKNNMIFKVMTEKDLFI